MRVIFETLPSRLRPWVQLLTISTGHRGRPRGRYDAGLMDRNILPARKRGLHAVNRVSERDIWPSNFALGFSRILHRRMYHMLDRGQPDGVAGWEMHPGYWRWRYYRFEQCCFLRLRSPAIPSEVVRHRVSSTPCPFLLLPACPLRGKAPSSPKI